MKWVSLLRTFHRYWKMAHHPRTPKAVRFLIYFGIAYTLLPIDLLPDWIPGLGLVDDAAILPGVIALAMILTPREVKEQIDTRSAIKAHEKREDGEEFLQTVRPIGVEPFSDRVYGKTH